MPAFKAFEEAARASIEEGDTLESIAERARGDGNDITAEDIGVFNWGARETEHVQELMRDQLGARKRASPMHFLLSPEDEPREPLRIPEVYAQDSFATARTHTLQLRSKSCTDQFIGCSSLPSITFPFDSSFVRPDVAEHLGAVEELIAMDDASRLMIFGHTDAVGDAAYNKRLSERRAWSVHAFILNDTAAWETLYNHPDEDWGVAVIQEILADLGHDPGAIDGDMGPATQAGMRAFLGLPDGAPVQNDAAFRAQLFAAYMGGKHDIEIGADRFLDPGYMGCAEFNLLNDVDAADARNRRVTIYAFHRDRPPNLPCAFDDLGPCEKQMVDTDIRHQKGFRCSFYDSLAGCCPGEGKRQLELYLLDRRGLAIPNCPFKAHSNGTVFVEGTADGDGLAILPDSVPNTVQIDWARPAGSDEGFMFSRPYIVSVSSALTHSGCNVRLANLGFDEKDLAEKRSVFSGFLRAHLETPFEDFAGDVDTWHSTGDPSHIEMSDDEFDLDEEAAEGDPDIYPDEFQSHYEGD